MTAFPEFVIPADVGQERVFPDSTPGAVAPISAVMSVHRELDQRIKRCYPGTPQSQNAAEWSRVDSRNQARRLWHPGAKDGDQVKLITRNGYDFADRYRLVVDAIASLQVKSCIIDGEAIVVDQNGLSVFDLIRYRRHDHPATICAFDVIELDGADLRRCPIEERKQRLAAVLRQPHHDIALNQTYKGDGALIYQHACALGCEGIVSKRLGSAYREGRTDQWLKIKNPEAPAVRREREIDWAKR
jgi:bifunctional non-homologous end joining protein LigD